MAGAIRALYAIAVAVFLVLTVGFGIVTFYPGPERLEAPDALKFPGGVAAPVASPGVAPTPPAAQVEAQRQYDEQLKQYDKDNERYHEVVLLLTTLLGAAALVLGVLLRGALDVLRVGLMLGGLFTVLWGLIAAAGDVGSGVVFVAALLALALLAALSHPRLRSHTLGVLSLDRD